MIKLANRNAQYRGRTAAATDQRVRHINEIIEGISSVKSYAWENPFFLMIGKLRTTETNSIAGSQLVRSANQGLMYCTPAIVSFITFVVYWRLNGKLTIPVVFSTISLLQVLRSSIGRMWTRSMELMSEALASCKRIENFLTLAFKDKFDNHSLKEHEENTNKIVAITKEKENQEKGALLLTMKRCNYYYDEEKKQPILQDISFNLHRNELLIVVGAVGCGKSTLLSAVLGEMKSDYQSDDDRETKPVGAAPYRVLSPNVSIAYCAQRPWVIATTIQANITIAGKMSNQDYKNPMGIDEGPYRTAMESTLLSDDLTRWPAGDHTEIGERGVSISGGQKARVSLARAVYADADSKL